MLWCLFESACIYILYIVVGLLAITQVSTLLPILIQLGSVSACLNFILR